MKTGTMIVALYYKKEGPSRQHTRRAVATSPKCGEHFKATNYIQPRYEPISPPHHFGLPFAKNHDDNFESGASANATQSSTNLRAEISLQNQLPTTRGESTDC